MPDTENDWDMVHDARDAEWEDIVDVVERMAAEQATREEGAAKGRVLGSQGFLADMCALGFEFCVKAVTQGFPKPTSFTNSSK
ncbi:hypothetical protein GGTG_11348 [Gaeumannomyces tritici R3-111a-1]|uniref:Uncharacterized protein n=1 Tax=Gaeumannomyces tritici (strain R3-111a-1) TaxID=644352 RepID=J3PCX9_GAET3|nr:hypothetical protein GGTG_11348 [Gaeumannomyces tritici R3-111a-1]EJT72101.1 hypothetical protein GGTG_11348 [Gaeumannomyces tritici R3-111a-1]